MKDFLKKVTSLPLSTRKYLYLVGVAILAVLAGYGWLTEAHVPLWVNLLATLMVPVPAVAVSNLSPQPQDGTLEDEEPRTYLDAA